MYNLNRVAGYLGPKFGKDTFKTLLLGYILPLLDEIIDLDLSSRSFNTGAHTHRMVSYLLYLIKTH